VIPDDPGISVSSLDFSDFFPNIEELVTIGRRSEINSDLSSNVSVSGNGVSVQFSGVGTAKTTLGRIGYNISLSGARRPRKENLPPVIDWWVPHLSFLLLLVTVGSMLTTQWRIRTFSDQEGIYYPAQTKVLIVVSTKTDAPWFPFALRVMGDFRVEFSRKSSHWTGRIPFPSRTHSGHSGSDTNNRDFKIQGEYRPHVAAEVLRDALQAAETNRTPRYIGLKAAVVGYLTVQD
jgi:hypothetical protein